MSLGSFTTIQRRGRSLLDFPVDSLSGLPRSSRALSRSGKKVLHVDAKQYYGGDYAALSLQDASEWVAGLGHDAGYGDAASSTFSNPIIDIAQVDGRNDKRLSFARAYSLTLSPQIIYTRSALLPALVTAKADRQLEFLAVGNWFVADYEVEATSSRLKLSRIPNGREDVFSNDTLDGRSKRALMKFLRFVTTFEDQEGSWAAHRDVPLMDFLRGQFHLTQELCRHFEALTLSDRPSKQTLTSWALPRIARHLRSIGLFGPGFGAVVPKWGGLAEVAQVGCRAGAVGGGVYVLGNGIHGLSLPASHISEDELRDRITASRSNSRTAP
ncbi:hypothetical protein MRB53_038400 [Persea americana]|nr:hypothetical protein MRB53_038400 [Persea americana]